ncbi:MAG: C40 family peptidase [candidate division Zixibacteria bacterium]|nr:C40 family peptidase [candidate division Zixibacteria bacterium]
MTQALFNEPLEILQRLENYSHVRLWDGYQGYINNNFYDSRPEFGGDIFVISAVFAPIFVSPDIDSLILGRLPFSAEIRAEPHSELFLRGSSSRYGDFYIRAGDIISPDKIPKLNTRDISILIDNAMRFLSVPYLWGGKSFFGFDCSGFVQVLFSYYGVKLPRDSKDQGKKGKEIERDNIQPGDLLLFKNHVAIAISDKDFIHSSLSRGGVAINSLDKKSKLYLKNRDFGLRSVRRIVEN